MIETEFTRLVGCAVPIQQAVLGGGVATAELALAVAGAGGLGMLAMSSRRSLEHDISSVRAQIGSGRWPRGQCGSLDEAKAAVDAGCDFVVVQGVEAGGHVRGELPLLSLLDAVLPEVAVPVVAAGGIATGRTMAAALAAGASAVRIGTRFVASVESGAHPAYKDALVAAASGADTVVTTAFGVGWPDAPHRVLRHALEAAETFDGEVLATLGDADVPPFSPLTPNRRMSGHIEACAQYCGQGVGAIAAVKPAGELVTRFAAEAEKALRAWCQDARTRRRPSEASE